MRVTKSRLYSKPPSLSLLKYFATAKSTFSTKSYKDKKNYQKPFLNSSLKIRDIS